LNEGGRPVTTPPPTSNQVALVERLVGVKLPETYVEFLRFSNGGHPEVDTFDFDAAGRHMEWGINRFFRLSTGPMAGSDDGEDVISQYQHRWPGAPREILPIAGDGLGNLICLDLTKEGNGRVVLWVHDREWPLLQVAESFEELIDALRLNPDYI